MGKLFKINSQNYCASQGQVCWIIYKDKLWNKLQKKDRHEENKDKKQDRFLIWKKINILCPFFFGPTVRSLVVSHLVLLSLKYKLSNLQKLIRCGYSYVFLFFRNCKKTNSYLFSIKSPSLYRYPLRLLTLLESKYSLYKIHLQTSFVLPSI